MNINCDGVVYNPLGGASYMFEKEIIPYLLMNLTKNIIKISIGAQPNSSPHFGTLETIALSFGLAKKIIAVDSNKKVIILYEVIETAQGEETIIDGIKYQKNLKEIIKNKDYICKRLDPKHNNLRIRMSCPKCGLTDKNSIKNKYTDNNIIFYCPNHGEYTADIIKDTSKFEYNSPLRNLI